MVGKKITDENFMRSTQRPFALFAAATLTLLGLCRLEAEVIVAEEFPNNTRTAQAPPVSLQWYASNAAGTTVADRAIALTKGGEKMQAIWAGFPSVSLEVGDRLVFSCHMRAEEKVGLVNSGVMVSLLAAQGEIGGEESEPKVMCAGYRLQLGNSQHTRSGQPFTVMAFDERKDAENRSPMLTSHSGYKRIATAGPTGRVPYEPLEIYRIEFSIERATESDLLISAAVEGGSFTEAHTLAHQTSGTDDSITTTFDTLGLTINGATDRGGFPHVTFSDLKLEVLRAGATTP